MDFEDEPKGLVANIKHTIREIYEYRVVLGALVRRNTAGRYKSTYVGFAWHLLLPILMVIVLHITFTSIRPRAIDDFWIYLSAGMFPLTFMSGALRGNSIVRNANYMTKMYFPREIVVLAETITSFIGVLFAFTFIIVVILASGQHVNWFGMAFLPVELFLMFIFGMGCTFLVSTITVFVKDLGHLMSVVMRLVFYITPTFFFVSEAKGLLNTIIWVNPITYFIETFHQILYFGTVPDLYYVGVSALLAVVMFIIGYAVFYRCKDRFAEVL